MTEITQENYQLLLSEILEKVQAATFVTFDAEFSGLGAPPGEPKNTLFDSGAERYAKLRKIVLQNTCPLVGFSIFRRVDEDLGTTNLYEVDAYQAYVSEPSFGTFNNGVDRNMLSLEYKCGKFLRKCDFDFNALLRNYVPYLNATKVEELRRFWESDEGKSLFNPPNVRRFSKTFFPPQERKVWIKQENVKFMSEIFTKRLRGLSAITDVIRENGIPLVGHNFGLDLLNFVQMFCDDLPEDYDCFKKLASTCLPSLYDTKHMLSNCKKILLSHPAYRNNLDKDKLKSSSLYAAFRNTSKIGDRFKPSVRLNPSCEVFEKSLVDGRIVDLDVANNALTHSPAFDACITGIVFLNIGHVAARIDKNFAARMHYPTTRELFENVQLWKNQIFLSRAAIRAMHLTGNDAEPFRPKWNQVKSREVLDMTQIKEELVQFGTLDVDQIDNYTFRFAAAGAKSAREMKLQLQKKGFAVKYINVPTENGKHCGKMDAVYDTTKNLG